MVITRSKSKEMSSNLDSKHVLQSKIDSSKLSSETKEIFAVLLDFFDSIIKKKDDTIASFQTQITTLEDKVEFLQLNLDECDQYNRRETIVFSGNIPAETPNENCTNHILNMLEGETGMKIEPHEISTAHRIGKVSGMVGGNRKIVAKFCRGFSRGYL